MYHPEYEKCFAYQLNQWQECRGVNGKKYFSACQHCPLHKRYIDRLAKELKEGLPFSSPSSSAIRQEPSGCTMIWDALHPA